MFVNGFYGDTHNAHKAVNESTVQYVFGAFNREFFTHYCSAMILWSKQQLCKRGSQRILSAFIKRWCIATSMCRCVIIVVTFLHDVRICGIYYFIIETACVRRLFVDLVDGFCLHTIHFCFYCDSHILFTRIFAVANYLKYLSYLQVKSYNFQSYFNTIISTDRQRNTVSHWADLFLNFIFLPFLLSGDLC